MILYDAWENITHWWVGESELMRIDQKLYSANILLNKNESSLIRVRRNNKLIYGSVQFSVLMYMVLFL